MQENKRWTENISLISSKVVSADQSQNRIQDGQTEQQSESRMRLTALLGFMAGILTTISFVPQVLHAWRSKRCDDLSWGMLLTFSGGVVLWLIYGIRLWAMPVIVANAVTLALLLIIMALKARYTTR
jgi:MtN3 and saliva related transmembrane protein